MNLLTDPFISTTEGKVSLRALLTDNHPYQLQYNFDETQLSMLQLLSSLSTVVLKPTLSELKAYIEDGVSVAKFNESLKRTDASLFEDNRFMRSKAPADTKEYEAPITKLVSGIECGTSVNALGLFSEVSHASIACSDCLPVLNYNLHMNIKGECFSKCGATGIRGGGAISTLVAAKDLGTTILANTVAVDYFSSVRGVEEPNNRLMWDDAIRGDIYYAHKIGLERGLFALAYHIDYSIGAKACVCDICGQEAEFSVERYRYTKYTGSYGSTKKGRDGNAKWWPHPYTPVTNREEGTFPVCARDENWQSWQDFKSYVIKNETDKELCNPAMIVDQYQQLMIGRRMQVNLLVGGNVANQGSITGRVYDLYSMPEHWDKNLHRVTQVIDVGLLIKNRLSTGLNKMFGTGYDKNFIRGIKDKAMQTYISNAQQIIQRLLMNVDRKEASLLRTEATALLREEAKSIYQAIIRKYQHDLPLFKSLIKGERELLKKIEKTE